MAETALNLTALSGIPVIQPGDDLVRVIVASLDRDDQRLADGDVLVVTSKIVSKSEGQFVRLAEVTPSHRAEELAAQTGKDARVVELALRESVEVSRVTTNIMVTRHRLGFVSANAGIDQSNVDGGDDTVLLLPRDPDASARAIRDGLEIATGAVVGIVISDSHGRPFRFGNVGVAIGVAGVPGLIDLRGEKDMFGRVLRVSVQGYADMIAGAAGLLTGEGAEGLPVVLMRGLRYAYEDTDAGAINRPPETSLYR